MDMFGSVLDTTSCLPSCQPTASLPHRSLWHLGTPFSTSRIHTSAPAAGSNVTGLSQSEHSIPWPLLLVQMEGKDFNVTEEE